MLINKFDIGPHINTYRGNRIRIIEVVAIILLSTILFVIPFLIGLYRTIYGYAQYGPVAALSWGIPWLFFSLVCFLIISIYSIHRLNTANFSIALHKHGIIFKNILRKEQVVRWNDISALYVMQYQSRSKNKSLKSKAVICTKENVRYSLRDSTIENLPDLLSQIKASVYVHLYPKIREKFRKGETISFGPINAQNKYIKINQMGLMQKSSQIPFTDIDRITVRSGQLLIKLNNNEYFRISTANIPNIEILLDLIRSKPNG